MSQLCSGAAVSSGLGIDASGASGASGCETQHGPLVEWHGRSSAPPPPSSGSGLGLGSGSGSDSDSASIGGFLIERTLGQGAMGVVYLARDPALDRQVAVKVISPELAGNPSAQEQFYREAQILASLRSDAVAQIYAFGPHEGGHFFAMEYVVGRNLESIISDYQTRGAFAPVSPSIAVLQQLARGLAALHASGVVHRDIKPSNVVIEDRTGRPVLIDFGIAHQCVRPGCARAAGTPLYMAPEQLRSAAAETSSTLDASALTPQLDIYSLGCVGFELLTGRPPFLADSVDALFEMHRTSPPPRVSSIRPQLHALDAVIARALEKDPAMRFPNAEAFVAALERAKPRALDTRNLAAAVRAAPAAPAQRVLVIDTDPSFRELVARVVQDQYPGAEITTACTGAEALETFESTPAHVVVIDLRLPDLDGTETLSMIRMLPHGGRARVVVCGPGADDRQRWRFSRLHVRSFLVKPASYDEVHECLVASGMK
jgi:eukaryotic-like serine/threonine-protein kinase